MSERKPVAGWADITPDRSILPIDDDSYWAYVSRWPSDLRWRAGQFFRPSYATIDEAKMAAEDHARAELAKMAEAIGMIVANAEEHE